MTLRGSAAAVTLKRPTAPLKWAGWPTRGGSSSSAARPTAANVRRRRRVDLSIREPINRAAAKRNTPSHLRTPHLSPVAHLPRADLPRPPPARPPLLYDLLRRLAQVRLGVLPRHRRQFLAVGDDRQVAGTRRRLAVRLDRLLAFVRGDGRLLGISPGRGGRPVLAARLLGRLLFRRL